jgi:hypothetical protein
MNPSRPSLRSTRAMQVPNPLELTVIRTFLVAALLALSNLAQAEILTWRFDIPKSANIGGTWGWLGDEQGPYTGEVISTKVVLKDFTMTAPGDASEFFFTFDVPTLGKETWIGLMGEDLGWSGVGVFNHSFTTDRYNGEIREGRFGIQIDGAGGYFAGEAYLELTIDGLRPDPLFFDSFDDIYDEK